MGKHGVVATVEGQHQQQMVLLRADALPEDGVALKVALERVVAGVAAAHRVQARLDIKRGGGALVNDARCSELATQCVHELFGADASVQFPPLMVSENFGDFFALCPGVMALVGAQNPSVGACYPHRHPKFNIDEDALTQGGCAHGRLCLAQPCLAGAECSNVCTA